ncbi:hypothetical protein CG006_01750 [Mesoplasma florum]|uniref:hypothetical protein n=1 Tax=Mesoplasma florum TaxID=2151 RepID=UPI000D03CBE0|nr:hypothetical protein [Mesoplasma florum]AVN63701.1 hypothetical protein CG006_01750 [Mesoplasma florum]
MKENVKALTIVENYFLNELKFCNNFGIYFKVSINNDKLINFIEKNIKTISELQFEVDITRDETIVNFNDLDDKIYNYFYKYSAKSSSDVSGLFDNGTLYQNDYDLLIELLDYLAYCGTITQDECREFKSFSWEIWYHIGEKLKLSIEADKKILITNEIQNTYINSMAIITDIFPKIENKFYKKMGFLPCVTSEINEKTKENLKNDFNLSGSYKIFLPFGRYTFKYMIAKIVKKLKAEKELGIVFEKFTEKIEEKLCSKKSNCQGKFKNVNAINLVNKTSEEFDYIFSDSEYIYIFEYKSSFIDIFKNEKINNKDQIKIWHQKFKKIFDKKNKSIQNIIDNINDFKFYSSDKKDITNYFINKKIKTLFITNQFWSIPFKNEKIKNETIILDYNFFDLLLSSLNYRMDIFYLFHNFLNELAKNKNLTFVESDIYGVFMNFTNPSMMHLLSTNAFEKQEQNAVIITDHSFLLSEYLLLDLSKNYFMKEKNINALCSALVSNHFIPSILNLKNTESDIFYKYFTLSSKEKFEVDRMSYDMNNKIIKIKNENFELVKNIISCTNDFYKKYNNLFIYLSIIRKYIV